MLWLYIHFPFVEKNAHVSQKCNLMSNEVKLVWLISNGWC